MGLSRVGHGIAVWLLFPKGVRKTVGEWLKQKRKQRSLARNDRGVDWHSRVKLHLPNLCQLIGCHLNRRGEVGVANPLVRDRIRRQIGASAVPPGAISRTVPQRRNVGEHPNCSTHSHAR